MKLLLQITILFLFLNCNAQLPQKPDSNLQVELINKKIEILSKKNDSLGKKINEYKSSNNSFIEVIDKVDNLYNNNFNRFLLFWTIVASIIIIGIPYYITRIQKKILEIKKSEIFNHSQAELNKLENKFSLELKEKYIELSDLISKSNEDNNETLKKEFIKSHIVNLYIAAKINEVDKKYDNVFSNLSNAVIKSNSIQYYFGVKYHLNNILTSLKKFKTAGIPLDQAKLKSIGEKLKILRDIEEIDQELLEKTIDELQ